MPVAFAAPRVNVIVNKELPAPSEGPLKSTAGREVYSPPPTQAMSRVGGGVEPTAFSTRLLGGTAGSEIPMGSRPMPMLPSGSGGTAPATVAPVAPPVVPVGPGASPTTEWASLPLPAVAAPPAALASRGLVSMGEMSISRAEFDALRGQVNTMQQAIGQALEAYKSGLSQVASRVDQLTQEVGQAIALSSNASNSLQVLAKNAGKSITDVSSQLAALNQAVLALARGATETFTPRSIKVPVATPSIQQMPSTVGNKFPTGHDESLTGKQGTPGARLAFYRR